MSSVKDLFKVLPTQIITLFYEICLQLLPGTVVSIEETGQCDGPLNCPSWPAEAERMPFTIPTGNVPLGGSQHAAPELLP